MVTAAPLRRSLATAFVALSLTAGISLADAAPTEAAAAKPCAASMSVTQPKQNTTTVNVSKVGAKAKVTTRARYKTTTTVKNATASTRGTAAVPYAIARATPGVKVVVDVTAVSGKTTWKCSTSFTPRRK